MSFFLFGILYCSIFFICSLIFVHISLSFFFYVYVSILAINTCTYIYTRIHTHPTTPTLSHEPTSPIPTHSTTHTKMWGFEIRKLLCKRISNHILVLIWIKKIIIISIRLIVDSLSCYLHKYCWRCYLSHLNWKSYSIKSSFILCLFHYVGGQDLL